MQDHLRPEIFSPRRRARQKTPGRGSIHWLRRMFWGFLVACLCASSPPPSSSKQAQSGPEHGQTLRLPRAGRAPRVEAAETPDLDQALRLSRRRDARDAPGGDADVRARRPTGRRRERGHPTLERRYEHRKIWNSPGNGTRIKEAERKPREEYRCCRSTVWVTK